MSWNAHAIFFFKAACVFHDVYAIDVIETADANQEDKFGGTRHSSMGVKFSVASLETRA